MAPLETVRRGPELDAQARRTVLPLRDAPVARFVFDRLGPIVVNP